MNNKKLWMVGIIAFLITSNFFMALYHFSTKSRPTSPKDEVILSIIKDDSGGFVTFLENGGDIHAKLKIAGIGELSVVEALVHFERTEFIKILQERKIPFLLQNIDGDVLTMSLKKNNPELLGTLLKEKPNLSFRYGKQKESLLHLAAKNCSDKLILKLQNDTKFNLNEKNVTGKDALNIAAENNCKSVLKLWKRENMLEDQRAPASVASAPTPKRVPNFYRKRELPKEKEIDYSSLIEPETRPEGVIETAAHSEFSD